MAVSVFGGPVATGDASKELGGTLKVSWNVDRTNTKFAISDFAAGRYVLTLVGEANFQNATFSSFRRAASVMTYAGTAITAHPAVLLSGGEGSISFELATAADGVIIEGFDGAAVLREWALDGTTCSITKPGDAWTFNGTGRIYSPTDAIMTQMMVCNDGTTERIYAMNERAEADRVFISTDGGQTWESEFFIDEIDSWYYNPFMYDDVNDKVWLSTQEDFWFVSDDHFATPPVRVAKPTGVSRAVTEYRQLYNLGDGVFVSNVSENNMLRSFDYGETWEEIDGALAPVAWRTNNVRYHSGVVLGTGASVVMYMATESSDGGLIYMTDLKNPETVPTQVNLQIDTTRSYYDVAYNDTYICYTSNEGLVRITRSNNAITETLAAPWAAHWMVSWTGSSWVFLPRTRSTQHYIVINADPLSTPLPRDLINASTEENWACQSAIVNGAGEVVALPWMDDDAGNPYDQVYDIKISDDDGLTFDNYNFEMGGPINNIEQVAIGGSDGLTWIARASAISGGGNITYDAGKNWKHLPRMFPSWRFQGEGYNNTTQSQNEYIKIISVGTDGNQKFFGTFSYRESDNVEYEDCWFYSGDGGVTFYDIFRSETNGGLQGFNATNGGYVFWTGTRFIITDYARGYLWTFTPPANPADFSVSDIKFLGDFGDGLESAVAYGDGKFIALRESTERVVILRDGSDTFETYYHSPIEQNWSGLAYGNGIWVAIAGEKAEDATGYANGAVSIDGIQWEPINFPYWPTRADAYYTNQLVFTGTHFVFRSEDYAYLMRSTDGFNWEQLRSPYAGTRDARYDELNPGSVDVDLTRYPNRSSGILGGAMYVYGDKLYMFDQRMTGWNTPALAQLTA